MKNYPVIFVFLAILLSLTLSCSGSLSTITTAVDLIKSIADGPPAPDSNHFLWSYNLVYVDPANNNVEIVPVRAASTHWNLLSWLEQAPCKNCFKIKNIHPSGHGTVLCDIEIKHPFPSPNLTGFDVRGIAMFDGSHSFPVFGLTMPDRSMGDGELVNADGYTTLYNSTTIGSGPGGLQGYMKGRLASATAPSATLNGFKRFVTDNPANTRNAFYSGDTISVTYEIAMPSGPFVFGYAVDGCWAPPTVKPVKDPMTDFPISANCEEPWKVVVSSGDLGSAASTEITIDVYDWSGKDSHPVPAVECPEIENGAFTAVWAEDGPGYSRYVATICNELNPGPGDYRCLVSVEANENDPTGKPWLNLTSYQLHTISADWLVEKLPPIALALADPLSVSTDEPVHFMDNGSNDPDGGSIVKYEWDWDNDGTFDGEGSDTHHSWSSPGTYYVQFRVTDDEGATDTLDKPIKIEVTDLPHDSGWALTWLATANDVLTDPQDNVYVCGYYGGTTDFDPGDGIDNHVSLGLIDAFISKFDKDGVFQWARTWGGPFDEQVCSIATDSAGNIYATGYFYDYVDFDPGPGEDIHFNEDGMGIFVSKFSPDGEFIWARTWGSPSWNEGNGVDTDPTGNIYVTGDFYGLVDFDPGPGLDLHGHEEQAGIFLSKFDTNGDYLWARTWIHLYGGEGHGVAVDDNSDAYVANDFYSTGGYRDASITKYNAGGDLVWEKNWGGPLQDTCNDISEDSMGNLYVTGSFEDTADFDSGPGTDFHTSNGSTDIYLSKFDTDGNFGWARTWGSSDTDYEYGWGVYSNSSGEVCVAGYFNSQVDFDPSDGIDLHISNGGSDCYVSKFSSNGSFLWARTWGGTGYDGGRGVCTGSLGAVYSVGEVNSTTVDFDPGPGEDIHTNEEGAGYLSKFLPDGSW